MLFRVRLVSPAELRTGEDAPSASLIDLTRSVQTELLGPAYCATVSIRP